MKYTLTAVTPLLVGDGQKLSPIDYMVWKDQVNVLDQRRIFKLLSKGPRLDNYLQQIKKAEKLDFQSWGGFAQNYAGRRIPFEHASSTEIWQQARAEFLHIPTFCAGPSGPYVPGSALKGALRTGLAHVRLNPTILAAVAQRMQGDRPLRSPGEALDHAAVGNSATSRTKAVAPGDSSTVATGSFKVYLMRVSTLVARGQALELGWKMSPRGNSAGNRPQDSTPHFVEMAVPGTSVEGRWDERSFYTSPEIARELGWKSSFGPDQILAAANEYAAHLLAAQKQYAETARLGLLKQSIEALEAKLAEVRSKGRSCLLCLGFGGGLLTKSAMLDLADEPYRQLLKATPFFSRAIQSGLPFPKTRAIVFLQGQPATLPGWSVLSVG